MASEGARRPSSTIESMATSNVQDAGGHWIPMVFRRLMWVTMQPSMKGVHKIARRHVASPSHHWKGRVLEFKLCKDGKRLAKVQHVYTSNQLRLAEEFSTRFPANCKSLQLTSFLVL